MIYRTLSVGQVLDLKPFHHYYSLPLIQFQEEREDPHFIICFKKDLNLFTVDMEHPDGHTFLIETASLFATSDLLEGIAAVPLDSLDTVRVLSYPKELYDLEPSTFLENLVTLYQKEEEILHFLKTTKNIGDQVTGIQLKLSQASASSSDFDPFRYTRRYEVEDHDDLAIVASKDYDFIPDFHPFLYSKRNGSVYSLPAHYTDQKTGKSAKLEIMGWYFRDQELKIRWKPKHTRKRRWRSSRISIDIVTGNYFFQGEVFKNSSAPVFLEQLNFAAPVSYQTDFDQSFKQFLSIVDEQKRKALLRKVHLK